MLRLALIGTFALTFLACSDAPSPSAAAPPPAAAPSPPPPPSPPRGPPTPHKVETGKGTFAVPGIAYADGRDPNALPPLTIMNINVWDNAPRSRVACGVRHGDKLSITDDRLVPSESRSYFHIVGAKCDGWLPADFLSPTKKAAIGDHIELR